MLDLRQGLEARLFALSEEREKLQSRLKEIDGEESAYRQALAVETSKLGGAPSEAPSGEASPEDSSLRDFVLGLLNGHGTTLEDIRDRAVSEGRLADSASPGRSIQGVLAGMAKTGLIVKNESGQWRRKEPARAAPLLRKLQPVE